MSLSGHDLPPRLALTPPQSVRGVCYLIAVLALVFVSLPSYVLYLAITEGTLKKDAVTFGLGGVLVLLVAWCIATSVLLWRGSRHGLRMYSALRLLLAVKRSFAETLDAELRKPEAVQYFDETNA